VDKNIETMSKEERLTELDKLLKENIIEESDYMVRFNKFGLLNELSRMEKNIEGLRKSIFIGKRLLKDTKLKSQIPFIYYNLAIAWGSLDVFVNNLEETAAWKWHNKEADEELIANRMALKTGIDSTDFGPHFFVHYGNLLSKNGRIVNAIESWKKALKINPCFCMANGNLGIGLYLYGLHLYHGKYKAIMLKIARQYLKKAVDCLDDGITFEAASAFKEHIVKIEEMLPAAFLEEKANWDKRSLGLTDMERNYRLWCLENNFFLNPFNDILQDSFCASDMLSTPTMFVGKGKGPRYQGLFNVMKEEFISARMFLYESINENGSDFIDNDSFYYDCMDDSVFGNKTQKMKVAFRMFYSILDKVAYFLYDYLELEAQMTSKISKKVYFRNIWNYDFDDNGMIAANFDNKKNWPMKGLYWISRDIFENNEKFIKALEPDAAEMNRLRNAIEHKYLKVFPNMNFKEIKEDHKIDTLAKKITIEDLKTKTIKLLKLSREALIYLSLSVNQEEKFE